MTKGSDMEWKTRGDGYQWTDGSPHCSVYKNPCPTVIAPAGWVAVVDSKTVARGLQSWQAARKACLKHVEAEKQATVIKPSAVSLLLEELVPQIGDVWYSGDDSVSLSSLQVARLLSWAARNKLGALSASSKITEED